MSRNEINLRFERGKDFSLSNQLNFNVWFVMRQKEGVEKGKFKIIPAIPYSKNGEKISENAYRQINHYVRLSEVPSE